MKILKAPNIGRGTYVIHFMIENADNIDLSGKYSIETDIEVQGDLPDDILDDLETSEDLSQLDLYMGNMSLDDEDEIYLGCIADEDREESDIYLNFRRSDPYNEDYITDYDRETFMRLLYFALYEYV